jgi:hypothetical protein
MWTVAGKIQEEVKCSGSGNGVLGRCEFVFEVLPEKKTGSVKA